MKGSHEIAMKDNMIEVEKYNLATKLIDTIYIFDENNRVTYEGITLKQVLKEGGIDNEDLYSSPVSLLEKLEHVRQTKKTEYFKIPGITNHFMLFPPNPDSRNIILSFRKNLQQIGKMEHDLKERVKELECLYNISHELEYNKSLDTALRNCAAHIVSGFQYSEFTSVIITLDGKTYKTQQSKIIKNELTRDIVRNSKKRGEIQVIYHEEAGFIQEEYKLVEEIAGKISRAIEKLDRTRDLENRKQILTEKNKTLISLTEECQQSRQKLEAFFSAITDPIVVIDRSYNIIMTNQGEVGELVKCHKLLFNIDEICPDCPAVRTFKSAQKETSEREYRSQIFLMQSFPIFTNGKKVDRALEVCRDVTKEKRMEFQLLQSYKLASLGKLVAGIAHEINNPNTFILGNLNIIREAFDDILPVLDAYYDNNQEYKVARLDYTIFRDSILQLVEDMQGGAKRMKKIVQDLRNYAKKDEGLLTESVEINRIIENTLRLVENQVRRNARIDINLNRNIPEITGNIQKLEQVMVNILINASQAIEGGKGIISIQTDYLKDSEEVSIEISDNGKGMDEKTRKSIFDPFFTTKRGAGGTGLGLSITYSIIKEHKGKIYVDSKPGKGTKFSIFLPVEMEKET